MTPPVDNFKSLTRMIAHDELPYEEALVRLYELSERYSDAAVSVYIGSASETHLRQHGHRLAFGCCRDAELLKADVERYQRALHDAAKREVHGRV